MASTALPRPTPRPPVRPKAAAGWRARWRQWWVARHVPGDSVELTQRNVYILPTRAGLLFAFTLVVLLIASINYQLSLGYLLTFLLAGAGVVSMHVTHGTLRGLQMHLRAPEPVHAGDAAMLEITLASTSSRPRFGIGLRAAGMPAWTWFDVPALGHTVAHIGFVAAARGLHALPVLQAETQFPLGLFRAWTVWRPAAKLMVYPRAERPAAPLPAARPVPGGPSLARGGDGGEVEGVRAYRRGDPMKLIAWRKVARTLEASGELVSRDTATSARSELWLDWAAAAGTDAEARLSRLAAWVMSAHRAGVNYGLRLPGREWPPAEGEGHRRACLEALALWGA
jgi:uncharacterized protein (DUF58 family)